MKSLLAETRKKIQTMDYEKQKTKSYYTEKMREHDRLKTGAENARLELVKTLADKEKVIRDLKDVVRKLEDGKVKETSLMDKQKQIVRRKR